MHTCPKCNETWTILNGGLLPHYLERLNIRTEAWYPTDEKPLADQDDCPACEPGGQWDFNNVTHAKYITAAWYAGAKAAKEGNRCTPTQDQAYCNLLQHAKIKGNTLLNAYLRGYIAEKEREV